MGLFPGSSAAAEIIEALELGVSELSEKASKRISAETAMRISRDTRAASRDKLRGHITRAGWIATAMNSGKVRAPSNGTEQSLINSGRAFVEDVESTSKDFARHGVAPQDVSAAVETLETAIRGYHSAKAARSAAIEQSGQVLDDTMKHLLRFDALVASYSITIADPDHSDSENRFVDIGMSHLGRLLVVSFTDRKDKIRIISARLPTRAERKSYEETS